MNTHEQTKWLAEFYAEAHRTGRKIEKHLVNGKWEDDTFGRGPGLHSDPKFWRLRPEPQKAWVVWGPGGPSTILGESYAKQYARECGGTIQEITRPEK